MAAGVPMTASNFATQWLGDLGKGFYLYAVGERGFFNCSPLDSVTVLGFTSEKEPRALSQDYNKMSYL